MSYDNRRKCLNDLKELGFQVGAGFMVGLPGQKNKHLAEDLLFLRALNPHMIGIGPFIPHEDTPLGDNKGEQWKDTDYGCPHKTHSATYPFAIDDSPRHS